MKNRVVTKWLLSTLFICFMNTLLVFAQSPKREMRATWLATVWRLDWPSIQVPANGSESVRLNAINKQKSELIIILDKLQKANMNAVFFQIRSMSDALYPSSYENWSHFISSERGADPGYDPLAFAVEEAHKRGIELHAWINPYRYSSSPETHGNLPTDYAQSHPEWLLDYGGQVKILNPGMPEVIQRITDIVEEVVTNYDIDGIVFDDYFYVNGETTNSMDQLQFDTYNPDGLTRAEWRRVNCNKMIASVYNKIQELKPYVTFGVSPAGVAASDPSVAAKYGVSPSPAGSDWQYNGIYSDPLAWLAQGTLDYISPQLYWTTTSTNSYAKLAPWWSSVANKFGKHFYSSHSLSAMSGPDNVKSTQSSVSIRGKKIQLQGLSDIEKTAAEQNQDMTGSSIQKVPSALNYTFSELGLQVSWNRNSDLNGAPGSVFYATEKASNDQFVDYLKSSVFTSPALTPAISWKSRQEYGLVQNIVLTGRILSWSSSGNNIRYSVYAVPKDKVQEQGVFNTSKYLYATSYTPYIKIADDISLENYTFAVAVLDRYGNEFPIQVMGEIPEPLNPVGLLSPADGVFLTMVDVFSWESVVGVDTYLFEVSETADFSKVIFSRETQLTEINASQLDILQASQLYFWRVKARKANSEDAISVVRTFTLGKFTIIHPGVGEEKVSLTPTISWVNVNPGKIYKVEIDNSGNFFDNTMVYSTETNESSIIIPEKTLVGFTTYYVRISTEIDGVLTSTTIVPFTTLEAIPNKPNIISPYNGETIFGNKIDIRWNEDVASGYRVELATSEVFPPRSTKIIETGAYDFQASYEALNSAEYFIRLRANYAPALNTEWSPIVKVKLDNSTGIDDLESGEFKCHIVGVHRDKITLSITTTETFFAEVSLLSLSGVEVANKLSTVEIGKHSIELPIRNMNKGIYLLVVKNNTEQHILKLII